MGPIDTLVEKLKLLKAGKSVRTLYRLGLVESNGTATKKGRTFARRFIAEEWIKENADRLAKDFAEFAKLSKGEDEDDE